MAEQTLHQQLEALPSEKRAYLEERRTAVLHYLEDGRIAYEDTLKRYIDIGEQVKQTRAFIAEHVPHLKWEFVIKEWWGFELRQAQNYIRLYENPDKVREALKANPDPTWANILKALRGKPKGDKPPKDTPTQKAVKALGDETIKAVMKKYDLQGTPHAFRNAVDEVLSLVREQK